MYRVSVDVGGTFTDLVALNEDSGELTNIKVPTIPKSPEVGVIDAFVQFLSRVDPSDVRMVGHATTIATNALFGQVDLELPRVALITTKGFKDVIEIARQRRAEVYNLFFQRPKMLVKRQDRYEVEERIDHNGRIIKKLKSQQLNNIISKIRKNYIESVAIGFLNSYANTKHEKVVQKVLESSCPWLKISPSSLISNEYREYERISTAVVNATLMPIIETYLNNLEEGLKRVNIDSPLYVMQSNGGMAISQVASRRPATMVESGPASGVIASAWLGELVGERNIISFDMGGTTAKAGTVRGRIPELVSEYEVAGNIHMGRLVKGSGYPVRFPFIDLAECSAGGGTIARVDQGGTLKVGPMSAGAHPGPACYGRGGIYATITDANLVLGRLNPESLLNGEMEIYPDLATRSLRHLSENLGLSVYEAAIGILRIANSMMSKILRIVSVERGYDPRSFTLVAFGGAGPMHMCALAEELEINKLLVPPNPGMFSALGLLTSDLSHDFTRAIVSKMEDISPVDLEEIFIEMEEQGTELLKSEGISNNLMSFKRHLDIRYFGQGYEISIETDQTIIDSSLAEAKKGFHKKHREIYGYSAEDEALEIINAKLRAIGKLDKPKVKERELNDDEPTAHKSRMVYFGLEGWMDTPVYNRNELLSRDRMSGPAIIEQYDSTTVVYPSWHFQTDNLCNLVLRRLVI